MSSKEWISQQRRKVDQLVTIFPRAVATVHSEVMKRIYEEGQLDPGAGNAQYEYDDTKPIYINPLTSPGNVGKPQGKPKMNKKGRLVKNFKKIRVGQGLEQDRFYTTRARKTKYFASYKQYRKHIGREVMFVNLDLEGLQRRDNANSLAKLSANRWAVGFKNHANSLKWEGQVKKYGPYHKLTPGEHTLLRDLISVQRKKLAV